ncbi:MAG: hypothetical protein ABWJ42_02725 [Sulfolobales archaeon]
MESLVIYVLYILSLLSFVLYLMIALMILRVYKLYPDEVWVRLSLGFLLLASSQIMILITLFITEANIYYAMYTTVPALAVSGSYMIWSARRITMINIFSSAVAQLTSVILYLFPSSLDLIASVFLAATGLSARGYIRVGFVTIALAHILRSIWFILSPIDYAVYIILLAEMIRSVGAIIMTLIYTRRVVY